MLNLHERYPYRQNALPKKVRTMKNGQFNPFTASDAANAGGAFAMDGADLRGTDVVSVNVEGVAGLLIDLVNILIISPSRASGYGERF
ncbi:MAG: hypothetical protein DHS20C16_16380 [Phycisphaerae bacterium]|nr:MAG: hypothetical protein DHS20C16_16380 [Phycisphaerae bacterium]